MVVVILEVEKTQEIIVDSDGRAWIEYGLHIVAIRVPIEVVCDLLSAYAEAILDAAA